MESGLYQQQSDSAELPILCDFKGPGELLFVTLKNVWVNYTETNLDDINAKEHWIQLFLFYYQYVDDFPAFRNEIFQKFFNSIPEEICSFFLRHVYEIISNPECNSITSAEINLHAIQNEKNELLFEKDCSRPEALQLFSERYKFSQLILKTPSDLTKIVALRTFLTDKLGHHILEFLLKVDIQLIASQKGLCNLCMNLFPNSTWSDNINELKAPECVLECVGNLKFLEFDKIRKHGKILKCKSPNKLLNKRKDIPGQSSGNIFFTNNTIMADDAFEIFKRTQKSSDEIAHTLVQLLVKCASNEHEKPLSEQSMSVLLTKFALSNLATETTSKEEAATCVQRANANIIRCAMLQLIQVCMNNIFADDSSLLILDFRYVFQTLAKSFPNIHEDDESHELAKMLTNGLVYLILGVVHNLIIVKRQKIQRRNFDAVKSNFRLDELIYGEILEVVEICKCKLIEFLNLNVYQEDENFLIYKVIINALYNITENAEIIEQEAMQQSSGVNSDNMAFDNFNINSNLHDGGIQSSRYRRHRFINNEQTHCKFSISAQHANIFCFFQKVMLDLQTVLPRELQEFNLRYWLRVGLCCCHYTLVRFEQFLSGLVQQTLATQKHTYNFLQRKMLFAIFGRVIGEQQLNKRRTGSFTMLSATTTTITTTGKLCNHCDSKSNSLEFHMGLLMQYQNLYKAISAEMPTTNECENYEKFLAFKLFLKHLKDIAPLIPNNIAIGILAEIVLPIFRQHKLRLRTIFTSKTQEAQNMGRTTPTDVPSGRLESGNVIVIETLLECLNVFVTYLSDLRLIKAFFNEENIQHLEDLIFIPELIASVCALIKIGIDNVTFLGENSNEQAALSRRLITLQLKSGDHVLQHLNIVFAHLANLKESMNLQSNAPSENKITATFLLDESNSTLTVPTALKNLTPLDILKDATQLWSMNNDLLGSSQLFYKEFAKNYFNACEDESISEANSNKGAISSSSSSSSIPTSVNTKTSNFKRENSTKNLILKITKLNLNALNGFLLLKQRTQQKIQPDTVKSEVCHTNNPDTAENVCTDNADKISDDQCFSVFTVYPNNVLKSENNVFTCLFDSSPLFNRITNTTTTTTCAINNLICSNMSEHSCETNSFSIKNKKYFENIGNETFLHRLKKCSFECVVLFDIKNSAALFSRNICDIENYYTAGDNQINIENGIKNLTLNEISQESLTTLMPSFVCDNLGNLSNHHNHHSQTTTHNNNIIRSNTPTSTAATAAAAIVTVHNSESVIGKAFRMFGSLLSLSALHSLTDWRQQSKQKQQIEIDKQFFGFFETQSEYKEQLLKLFESTLAICIKAYQNETEIMEDHLKKLKEIILSNAFVHWKQYSEVTARENHIFHALQILLQVAELLNTHGDQTPIECAAGDAVFLPIDQNVMPKNIESISCVPTWALSSSISQKRESSVAEVEVIPKWLLKSHNAISNELAVDYITPTTESDVDSSEADYEQGTQSQGIDDGYEADGEIPEISESEPTSVELIASTSMKLQPSSRYRSPGVHNGLSRLVVDIVIELAKECANNPVGWCEILVQLTNRLYIIRDVLGGPIFILQSFENLLQSNDVRLKEFQQSILNLITDLNTPEILCMLFKILVSKTPPVDILIKHMHKICISTLRKPTAFVELEFPVSLDGNCITTDETTLAKSINRMRNYHLHCQTVTPFTRAPCVLPINHAKVWNHDGFTLSLWLQIKSTILYQKTHTSESSLAADNNARTHIVSIGSNQLMLCVYFTNSMFLNFEVIKPNGTFPTRDIPVVVEMAHKNKNHTNTLNNSGVKQETTSTTTTATTTNSTSTTTTNACERSNIETDVHSSSIRSALKHTKFVLLNSLNNIIHGPHDDGGLSNEPYFEKNSFANLKSHQLSYNKWTNFAIAVDAQPDELVIYVTIDGLEQHQFSIPCRNAQNLTRSYGFQTILLGEGSTLSRSNNTSTSNHASQPSTFDCSTLRFSISNLMLFNQKLNTTDTLTTLTAMGPDYVDMTPCQVVERQPNYGFLNMTKAVKANFGNIDKNVKILREARILAYTAQQPDLIMNFSQDTNSSSSNSSSGNSNSNSSSSPVTLMLYGELIQNHLQTLQTATFLCGGLSTLIFLFARTVELSSNAQTQSLALDILLAVALSDSHLYAEFLRNDYFSLIGYVIKTERCSKDVQLLKSIVNNACSQPLIHKKNGELLIVNENTTAVLVYPRLILFILQRYSDWYRSGTENSSVLEMLFQCVLALTREKHPQRNFNMKQLSQVGLFKALLNLCKVYIIESTNPVHISICAAKYFVEIVSVFAGAPPSASLLDEIMKLLLLFHKPSDCFITHDRTNFFFLLTPQPAPKEKTTSFRQNILRDHPGLAVSTNALTTQNVKHDNFMDAKSATRIKRIKQIHEQNLSPYKRPIRTLVENLKEVANCTRLKKNVLNLLNPESIFNWRTMLKCRAAKSRKTNEPRRMLLNRLKRPYTKCLLNDLRKFVKRTHNGTKRNFTKVHLNFNMDKNSTTARTTTTGGASENEYTDKKRSLKTLVNVDFYFSKGIVTLQEGLFGLLKDFFCLLPDSVVDEVIKHYIKIEFLLVLSNHRSCAVRAAIIRLLAVLSNRLSPNELLICNKNYFPQHLANQISIHATDAQMFEACLEWIYGVYGGTDAILNNTNIKLHLQQRFGINSLLSIASKLTTLRIDYAEKAFRTLDKIFVSQIKEQQLLIENGLVQCGVKALYNLYSKSDKFLLNTKTENAILELLGNIGKSSILSVGHINVIWDILNMLTFYQENQPIFVIKGFRSVQGLLQRKWIKMFFDESTGVGAFKVATVKQSTLSLAETKTRLNLLIDRCCQFFTVFDANYTPTENELKLFELLVSYCIATNQRYNNFIAWGLQPSRPRALRAFIVDMLWRCCQDNLQPAIVCDGKLIKSLLWLCCEEDLQQPIENLGRLCQHLNIDDKNSVGCVENELDKLELNRVTMTEKHKSLMRKTVYKFEALAAGCVDTSMETTRRVAELQNAERKLLINHMKDFDETATFTSWTKIIKRMTHDGAPWHCKERYENSWELDNTEGPSRVHTRLRRCHLEIDSRFIMPEDEQNIDRDNGDYGKKTQNRGHNRREKLKLRKIRGVSDYTGPLEYLLLNYDQQLNISLNAQILYNFPAKYLPVDGEIDGEIIITHHVLYFLATHHCKYFYLTCDISNISEVWNKRYQHQEKAFEIFLDTNQSLFFSLQNHDDWKIMQEIFSDKIIAQPDQAKVLLVTQQWREGLFTNWEYLMALNQIAGRTYNDLMQYPVFPWILSNYITDTLDLTEMQNFRKLEKPIAVQHEANEQHYINNYMYINNTMTNMGSLVLKPYHYSSHYSNSGTVLHFLVRVPPFTSYFLRYQDNNFDLPDRTFHALNTTWNLASRDSPTDVKELIPEFFCLPEMFENFERFDFGCRQNGDRVDHVLLPPWCQNDSRLFVLIHRQALECELVRKSLPQWIDLIFGYKQIGESAVEAINVFHPATYSSFLESEFLDPIERSAVETMIKTYGQMPRQLFKAPHPASKALNYCLVDTPILPSIRGLRWGAYVGSPQLPAPMIGNRHKILHAAHLVCLANTNSVYGLTEKSRIMQGHDVGTYNLVSWGYDDRVVRVESLHNNTSIKAKNVLYNSTFDEITVCGTDPHSNQLWFGHRSGRITVYKCTSVESNQRVVKNRQSYVRGLRLSYNSAFRKLTSSTTSATSETQSYSGSGMLIDNDMTGTGSSSSSGAQNTQARNLSDSAELIWTGPTVLIRHTDEITAITLSVEFKIVVTAGRDGNAVIWDLNDCSYIRTIQRPTEIYHSPVSIIAISSTLGDIVTVHTLPNQVKAKKTESDNRGMENVLVNKNIGAQDADECFEVTEESLDGFVNVSVNPNGKSMLRLHTINARYVQHFLHQERILAVCYSYIKEGVGINVIATAIEGGIVRLWSSWNLNFVSEISTGITNIRHISYSTHQHLVVLTMEAHIQVWTTDGLYGSEPKFPQISY